ncbi:MAG: pilus assembly protein N-terminal domain-containing protein [Alphaproteobacteria bacterium]|nr:pilus assembly protein N-terminal domain-containing protein [Alphaproteobacteria bacterium]MCB9793838.1 pilus assembly protein N-terminal domain-containing protein [Alphaproteobacteria bacterium]
MLISRMLKAVPLLLLGGVALPVAGALLSTPAYAQSKAPARWLDVEVGQSHIEQSQRVIHRVLISDDTVAELKILEQGQFQIRGLEVGTTDIWIWYVDDKQNPEVLEINVHRDLSELIRRVGELVSEGPPPRVYPLEERIVLEGPVPSLEALERIASVAAVYDEDFVNLMSVKGDHQVQLEVTFAEVSRTATREMGLNVLWGDPNGNAAFGLVSSGTSGDRANTYHPNNSAALNTANTYLINNGLVQSAGSGAFALAGVIANPANLAAILSVMENHQITKVLAEPTIVVLSGQQAEFLAGGEIPVPVAQNNNRVTLQFKEYGVILVFVPTVLANGVIDMRVTVEVSEVDSATGTRITGIEIPGFLVRKSSSHLRVNDGMTFAMAGLLSEQLHYSRAQVPLLGDIPVLGALFSYTQHIRDETELMIFVTPRLVRPMAEDEVPIAPGFTEDNNPNDFELFWLGMDHRAGSRTGEEASSEPSGPVGAER